MFDGLLDTCWNSDSGSPQSITFDFCRPIEIASIRVMFQGGFTGLDA